jgi:hypothetical protein
LICVGEIGRADDERVILEDERKKSPHDRGLLV